MVLTYGILTYLSIRLMKRKKRSSGNRNDGGFKMPEKPILPDLPDGVRWPDEIEEKEYV